jgi:hypothetical protein
VISSQTASESYSLSSRIESSASSPSLESSSSPSISFIPSRSQIEDPSASALPASASLPFVVDSNSLLGRLGTECPSCEFSEAVVEPSNITTSRTVLLDLNSSAGDLLGSLFIPPTLSNAVNTTLSVIYTPSVPRNFSAQSIAGAILDINLIDSNGVSVTQLDSPLTICLATPNKTKNTKGICLSFYNEAKAKWQCVDRCLTRPDANDDGLFCGQTDHLTNFALLLGGNVGGGDPCSSASGDNTLSWISLALIIGAIVIISLSVIAIEVYFRWRASRLQKQITNRLA